MGPVHRGVIVGVGMIAGRLGCGESTARTVRHRPAPIRRPGRSALSDGQNANDLSNTGGPASSFDTIYQFFGVQPFNLATAAPGDAGFNGGRWRVRGLRFSDYAAAVAAFDANHSGDFDSDEEVAAALAAGAATDVGVVTSFIYPIIELAG
jgi:hypothetical protein